MGLTPIPHSFLPSRPLPPCLIDLLGSVVFLISYTTNKVWGILTLCVLGNLGLICFLLFLFDGVFWVLAVGAKWLRGGLL